MKSKLPIKPSFPACQHAACTFGLKSNIMSINALFEQKNNLIVLISLNNQYQLIPLFGATLALAVILATYGLKPTLDQLNSKTAVLDQTRILTGARGLMLCARAGQGSQLNITIKG